jgi:hypothetical protein
MKFCKYSMALILILLLGGCGTTSLYVGVGNSRADRYCSNSNTAADIEVKQGLDQRDRWNIEWRHRRCARNSYKPAADAFTISREWRWRRK